MSAANTILGVTPTPPSFEVPRGACDCHTHVFGPAEKFPFSSKRLYTPGDASLDDLEALHHALHIDRVVVVHPSPYGADNACTVDAVRRLGGRARGVAVSMTARAIPRSPTCITPASVACASIWNLWRERSRRRRTASKAGGRARRAAGLARADLHQLGDSRGAARHHPGAADHTGGRPLRPPAGRAWHRPARL